MNKAEIMSLRKITEHRFQTGFTMIEVLVAVLVLAIGLLGVAGVQLVSMQQTLNSTLRSEATMYAQSVAERIRSNGGDDLATSDLDALKAQMEVDLGTGADLDIDSDGTTATIDVTWTERDPFAVGGTVTQTLTLDARL